MFRAAVERRRRCSRHAWCASRCTCGCSARPNEGAAAVVLAPGRGERGRGAPLRARRCCARTCPAPVLSESTPLSGTDRRHAPAAGHAGGERRLRGGGRRARRPARGRVPGHRRRPRAARLRGARPVRAPAGAGGAARSGGTALGGRLPGEPERRAALQGRAARAPPGWVRWSSWSTNCAARPVPARSTGPGWPWPHTVGRGANAGVVILGR